MSVPPEYVRTAKRELMNVNAELVNALLSTIEELEEWSRGEVCDHAEGGVCYCATWKALDQARAAIAKAAADGA